MPGRQPLMPPPPTSLLLQLFSYGTSPQEEKPASRGLPVKTLTGQVVFEPAGRQPKASQMKLQVGGVVACDGIPVQHEPFSWGTCKERFVRANAPGIAGVVSAGTATHPSVPKATYPAATAHQLTHCHVLDVVVSCDRCLG